MHELERTNKSVRVVDGSLVSFCKHILIKNVQRCQTACFSPFVLLFSFGFVSFVRFSRTYIYICYSVSACSRVRLLPKLYIHMHTTHQLARSSVRLTNRLVAGKSSAVPVPVQTIFACVYCLDLTMCAIIYCSFLLCRLCLSFSEFCTVKIHEHRILNSHNGTMTIR